jgi:hypothetical protein
LWKSTIKEQKFILNFLYQVKIQKIFEELSTGQVSKIDVFVCANSKLKIEKYKSVINLI